MAKVLRYFLGVMSPQGYVFRSDQLGEPGRWRCWVVMGGASATRSQLIARVRQAMEERCPVIEELLCSADPSALSGAIFPGLMASITDGEPPHAIRPRFPGCFEQPVPLWDCIDQAALWESREELIRRSRETERLSRDAEGYLYAAGALMGDLASIGAAAMDRGKLLAYARRLAAREFPHTSDGKGVGQGQEETCPIPPVSVDRQGRPSVHVRWGKEETCPIPPAPEDQQGRPSFNIRWGQEKVRFVSAITGEGRTLLRDTLAAAAPRIIAIEDDWGAASNALLEALRELAMETGNEVVTCRCPLFPFTKIDHLLLPQLGLGFITLNRATAPVLSGLQERTIHASRFSDAGLLRERRARGRFLRKAVSGMLEQAGEVLGQAAVAQRRVDEILLAATDQGKVERVTERVIKEISG